VAWRRAPWPRHPNRVVQVVRAVRVVQAVRVVVDYWPAAAVVRGPRARRARAVLAAAVAVDCRCCSTTATSSAHRRRPPARPAPSHRARLPAAARRRWIGVGNCSRTAEAWPSRSGLIPPESGRAYVRSSTRAPSGDCDQIMITSRRGVNAALARCDGRGRGYPARAGRGPRGQPGSKAPARRLTHAGKTRISGP
jgi:hypothetical protein